VNSKIIIRITKQNLILLFLIFGFPFFQCWLSEKRTSHDLISERRAGRKSSCNPQPSAQECASLWQWRPPTFAHPLTHHPLSPEGRKMSRCNKVELKSALSVLAFPIVFYGFHLSFSQFFRIFLSLHNFYFTYPSLCGCVYIILLQREPITIERAAGDADAIECHWLRVSSSDPLPAPPMTWFTCPHPSILRIPTADAFFFPFLFVAHPVSLYCGYDSGPGPGHIPRPRPVTPTSDPSSPSSFLSVVQKQYNLLKFWHFSKWNSF